MTEWSFEHVAETRAALRTIVADPAYGPTALSNVRVMSEVLPGLLRGARLERSVLVTAVKEGLASTMVRHVSEGMDARLAIRLSANFLAAISAVPLQACYWVSAELALALGLITVEQADSLGSGAEDARDDSPDGQGGVPVGDEQDESDLAVPPVTTGPSWPGQGGDRGMASPPGDGWADRGAVPTPAYGPPGPGSQPTQIAQAPTGVPDDGSYQGQPGQFGADDWVSRAVRDVVRPGLLAFNTPQEMQQGRIERVEVAVARSLELRDALTAGFRGRGLPEVVQVDTSPVMGVELRGSSFEIVAYSPPEQLVAEQARWQFDVTPVRSGRQTLTLCVSLRIDAPFAPGGRIAVPVLERDIRIHVDVVYGTRRFVAGNWQWLVGTAVGLGGGIAAWIALAH